jgi:hypothetical protein
MVGKRAGFEVRVSNESSSDIDNASWAKYRLPLKDLWEKQKTKAN